MRETQFVVGGGQGFGVQMQKSVKTTVCVCVCDQPLTKPLNSNRINTDHRARVVNVIVVRIAIARDPACGRAVRHGYTRSSFQGRGGNYFPR